MFFKNSEGNETMSKAHILKAEARTSIGTGPTRELRRRNMVPAIIYGADKEQVMLAIPSKELNMEYQKNGFLSHMFDLEIDKKKHRALPKEIQLHPVTDEILHIDFVHVDEKQEMKASVILHFINESKCAAIKQGGRFNAIRHSLEIHCLPKNIPENIEIDIAELSIGQSIHVKDLTLPKGVATKIDPNTTIATLVAGRTSTAETTDTDAETEEEKK
jgi:large subunit ribosomal protein L25